MPRDNTQVSYLVVVFAPIMCSRTKLCVSDLASLSPSNESILYCTKTHKSRNTGVLSGEFRQMITQLYLNKFVFKSSI